MIILLFYWAVSLLCYWILRSEINYKSNHRCSKPGLYFDFFYFSSGEQRCFSSFQTALKTRRVYSKVPFMHQFEKYFSKLFWSAVFKRLCPSCFSVWVSLAFEKAGFAGKLQPDYIINKGPNCDAIGCNSCNIHERNSESSNS